MEVDEAAMAGIREDFEKGLFYGPNSPFTIQVDAAKRTGSAHPNYLHVNKERKADDFVTTVVAIACQNGQCRVSFYGDNWPYVSGREGLYLLECGDPAFHSKLVELVSSHLRGVM